MEWQGGLIVEKYDKITKEPLAGARFKIVYSNGELLPDNEGLTSSNGLYTTDQNGQIVISKVYPGTLVVTEDKAPDFYEKDPTPQTVVVNAGDTQTLRFYDAPLCTLTILKRDAVTHKPLSGGQFLVQYSDGHVVGPNNGLYTTGADGTVTVSGLKPNATVVVSEQKAPKGYILDQTPKNIVVRSGVANGLIFDDQPGTTLIIQKFIEGTENEPLSGVAFKVTDGAGAAVGPDDGVYYTDKAGEIVLSGIEPGTTVKAREIKTVDGFVLDGTPQDILIKGGEVQRLTFWNKRAGTLIIEKLDSVTKAPLAGAQFKVLYADGRVVDTEGGKLSSNGIYFTDSNGQIKITNVVGTLVVTEEKCPEGYVMGSNDKSQTVVVHPQDTQTLRFYNDPLCSLTLTKLDSVTGKPVPNLVDTIRSDGRGLAVSRQLPLGRYTIREVKAPSNYGVNETPLTAYLEHEGQIVRFEVTNKSMSTGVSITKTGPAEAMAGQPVRYVFSNIANSSNVRLDNFYWRDTLPAEVRLEKIVTGTYNFPGTYKITYRVNGGEPQTLADNLSTQKNYTLAASAVALGLASNERVTEIMFVFGQAPGGFAQVEKPMLHCKTVSSIAAGSFVNKADVGGTYNGVWIQAVSRWVTTVYGKKTPAPKLPRTGY